MSQRRYVFVLASIGASLGPEGASSFQSPQNNVFSSSCRMHRRGRLTSQTALALQVPSIPPDFDYEKSSTSWNELHRQERRDFYNHEAWVRHRSPSRFFDNLIAIPFSKIVWMILAEVATITLVSVFVIAWNNLLVIGFEDFEGIHHDPFFSALGLPLLSLPKEPFLLSSPALSLLLVFRTNICWRRWDEARKAWGVIVNNSRTVARKTNSWIMDSDIPEEEKKRLLQRVSDAVWAFPRAERRHLLSEFEDEEAFVRDVSNKLPAHFAAQLIKYKRHRPSYALWEMTCAINELPLDMFRRIQIDEATSELCNAMGGCDRLYTSPPFKSHKRHTSRFLFLWLLLVPFTLWSNFDYSWNHIAVPFVATGIALGMLGIAQISIMLEEPFSLLPLQQITDGIGKSADEHIEYNEFDSSMSRTKLDRYFLDDFSAPEYAEAMSKETVIRHKEQNGKPSVSAQSVKPTGSIEAPLSYLSALHAFLQQPDVASPELSSPAPRASASENIDVLATATPYQVPNSRSQQQQHLSSEVGVSTEGKYLLASDAAIEEKLGGLEKLSQQKLEMLKKIEEDVKGWDCDACP